MGLKTYLDFAENAYMYFMDSYKRGVLYNDMGAVSQSICERYLKHLIYQYENPVTSQEENEMRSVLRTHTLRRLVNHLDASVGIELSWDTRDKLFRIDGFYFNTRYPGDDSMELTTKEKRGVAASFLSRP